MPKYREAQEKVKCSECGACAMGTSFWRGDESFSTRDPWMLLPPGWWSYHLGGELHWFETTEANIVNCPECVSEGTHHEACPACGRLLAKLLFYTDASEWYWRGPKVRHTCLSEECEKARRVLATLESGG